MSYYVHLSDVLVIERTFGTVFPIFNGVVFCVCELLEISYLEDPVL